MMYIPSFTDRYPTRHGFARRRGEFNVLDVEAIEKPPLRLDPRKDVVLKVWPRLVKFIVENDDDHCRALPSGQSSAVLLE